MALPAANVLGNSATTTAEFQAAIEAQRQYLADLAFSNIAGVATAGQLPAATTSAVGAVQLSSSTSSASETLAATAKAVKDVKDTVPNLSVKTAKWTGSATTVNKSSVTDFGIGLWAVNFGTSFWGCIFIPSTTQYCSTLLEGGYITYGYVTQLTFDGTLFSVAEKKTDGGAGTSYTINGIYKIG